VFGDTQIGADGNFDLSSLDGSNGFALNSVNAGARLATQSAVQGMLTMMVLMI
jgi:hypothetical protein